MFDDHARALKYFAWFSAGLFPFGIILEDLKASDPSPIAIYALLIIIGLLCEAMMYAEWRSDKAPQRRRKRR